MGHGTKRAAGIVLAAVIVAGCGEGGGSSAECAGGVTRACTCDDGASGEQKCSVYRIWTACLCPAPDGTDGGAADAAGDACEPAPDVDGDGQGCVRDCCGRECGFDGCGGLCGQCSGEFYCSGGSCIPCPTSASTCCDFPFGERQEGGLPLGAECERDLDCAFGKCLQAGEEGNRVNDVFGFCTRGCSCNKDDASLLGDEEQSALSCDDPPGHQGSRRHVILKCSTVDDCKAVDPGWTDCANPGFGTTKVCVARADE